MPRRFPKDPKAPKRPMSAYFLFMNKNRASFVEQVGSKSDLSAIGKLAGAKWGAMTDAEKAPFTSKAEKAKAAYEKKRAKYVQSNGYKQWCADKKAFNKKQKLLNLVKKPASWPKRAASAYFLWLNQARAKIVADLGSASDVAAVAKRAGEMWNSMDDAARAPFVAKNAQAKAKYEKQMAKFKKSRVYLKYLEDKKAAAKQIKADEKAAKKAATPKKAVKKVTKRRKSVRKTVRRKKSVRKTVRKTKKTVRKSRKSARKAKATRRK